MPLRFLEWLEPSKAVGLFLFCAITSAVLSLQAFFKKGRMPLPPVLAASLLALLWVLDMGRVPFLLLQPMPDPYQEQTLGDKAGKLRRLVEGKRMLSLHTAQEMEFTGEQTQVTERIFALQTHSFLANSNAVWGLRSVDRYLFLQVEGSENLVKYFNQGFPYKGSLLDVAGVGLFLQPQPLPAPRYKVVGKLDDDFLNLNLQASSDMRWVGGKIEYPDRPSVLNSLASPGNDWKKKIFLEKSPGESFTALAPVDRSLGTETRERNGYSRESAGRASFNENFPGLGYVVFNETYAPGWHAWVDGAPTPILRAYGLFMGVGVPAGKAHQVDFRYEPASFRLGLFITLLTLAFFAGGVLVSLSLRGSAPIGAV